MFIKKQNYSLKNFQQPAGTPPDDSVHSLRSWVRKIEQTTQCISSRLAAIEKRLSWKTTGSEYPTCLVMEEGPITNKETSLKKGKHQQLSEITKAVDAQLCLIQTELESLHQEITSVKEKMDGDATLINHLEKQTQDIQQSEQRTRQDFLNRLQTLERREPPIMKLGKLEIPVEITGVIGGILAFLIAALIWCNQKTLVFSPWFLTIIGIVFIGSAVLKTLHIGSFLRKSVGTLELDEKHPIDEH